MKYFLVFTLFYIEINYASFRNEYCLVLLNIFKIQKYTQNTKYYSKNIIEIKYSTFFKKKKSLVCFEHRESQMRPLSEE